MRAFSFVCLLLVAHLASADLLGIKLPLGPSSTTSPATPVCKMCITVAGLVKRYSTQVAKFMTYPCSLFKSQKTCKGTADMLITALKVGGEKNACSIVKMCSSYELPLGLSNVVNGVTGSIANAGSNALGSTGNIIGGLLGGNKPSFRFKRSIFDQTKDNNVEGLVESTVEDANEFFHNVSSVFGKLLAEENGSASRLFNDFAQIRNVLEHVMDSSEGNAASEGAKFFRNAVQNMADAFGGDDDEEESESFFNFRLKRSAEPVAEAEEEIKNIDYNTPENPSETDIVMNHFAEYIKENILTLLEEVKKTDA